MSSLLFDVPGPKARARHRIYTVITLVVIAFLIAIVVRKLSAEGVLTATVFNDTFTNNNVTYLLEGLVGTLKAAVVAILGALVLGMVLATARLSDHAVVRIPARVVIELFRAIPLVLLMIFLFFTFRSVVGPFGAVVTALVLYNGAVLAEVFRAGINAVQQGQSDAAYGIGLRKGQVMRLILVPQAVRFMLPAIISQCVIVLKDTSLGYVVVYGELVRHGRQVALFVSDGTILVYSTIALVFIIINYSLSKLAEFVERRLASRGSGSEAAKVSQANVGGLGGLGG
ncbi:MAG: amino acid ABC transporter permease [Nocardioidaceae bacterium]